jgi:hypothetical protein
MGYWYRTGTISVANSSTTVTGTLTGWNSTVRAGDMLHAGNNPAVEIASVTDNEHFELVQPWPYTTLSGANYGTELGPGWNDVTRLANEVATALANSTEILSGTGVPSNSIGSDGSVYFRQDVPEYYAKDSGSWGTAISLTGPQGPTGSANIATSTTSRTLNTGSMSFTVASGLSIQTGMRLRVSNSGSNYMEGVVTGYTGTTLTISMDRFVGSGTFAVWNIGPVGDKGDIGATGPSYSGTSTTSLTIGTGSTGAFTTQAGLAYVIGSRVRLASSASPSNYMEGTVTAYSGTSMTVNVDAINGSGTIASWNLSIAGIQGAQGIQGIQGTTGSTGPAGPGYAATSTTSNSVATGNKTFTTQAGLSYVVGSRARAADSANPATNWMEGVITAYSSTSMTIAVDTIAGSGTITSWNISLAGQVGATGSTGATGATGSTGPQGPQGQGIQPNATGVFADRSTYDAQPKGYVFLSSDGDGGSITIPCIFVKNSATSGDWSDAAVVGAGNDVPTLPYLLERTSVIEAKADYGAAGDGTTDDTTALNNAIAAAMNDGKELSLGPGNFKITSSLLADVSAVGNRFDKRLVIRGVNPGVTLVTLSSLADEAFSYIGNASYPESYLQLRNFRLSGNLTSGSTGVKLAVAAYASMDNMVIEAFDYNLDCTDVEQSQFSNCNYRWGVHGVRFNAGNLTTAPNSINFLNCAIGNNSAWGLQITNPNDVNIIGGSIQYNGATGATAGTNWGAKFIEAGNGYGNINLMGIAFEGNGGDADIISSQSTYVGTMYVIGCGFARPNSSRYPVNCLSILGSTASTYKLSGNTFRGYNTYTPNAGRPYFNISNTSAKIIDDGSNVYGSSTEQPAWAGASAINAPVVIGTLGAPSGKMRVYAGANCNMTVDVGFTTGTGISIASFNDASNTLQPLELRGAGVNVRGGAASPSVSDGAALGTTSLQWSDLFLAAGGVVNWSNGGVTLTESSDALLFAGASVGYKFDAVIAPTSSDGAALGSTSLMWSDLFLASGAVVNFNNGNLTLTHSSGLLANSGKLLVGASSSSVSAAAPLVVHNTTDQNFYVAGPFNLSDGVSFGSINDANNSLKSMEFRASQIYMPCSFTTKPPASITPANNGDMTFQLTSNTSLTIKVKGSDGTVRSVSLTLT